MPSLTPLQTFGEKLVNAAALNPMAQDVDTLCQLTCGRTIASSPQAKPFVKVVRSTTFSMSNNAATTVSWSSAPGSSDGMWSSGAPTLITVQTAGWYYVTFQMSFANASATRRNASLLINGTSNPANLAASHDEYMGSPDTMRLQARFYEPLNVGDVIRATALQASGGSINSDVNDGGVFLFAVWDALL